MLEFHNSDFILDVMTVPVISRSEVWSPYNADKGKVTNLGLLHKEDSGGGERVRWRRAGLGAGKRSQV